MSLEEMSDAELEAEVKRRATLRRQAPDPVKKPDWNKLIVKITGYVDLAVADQRWDEDWEQWIFETAMETVYGKNFFRDWFNKQDWA